MTTVACVRTICAALLLGMQATTGTAYADSYAVATDNLKNTFVSATAGVTFGGFVSNSSTAASLNGSGVSFAAKGPNPNSPISALGSASGRADETAGPVYYTLIGSDGTGYSWGDAIINQDETPATTLTARNAAETNIAGAGFANANGTNTTSTGLSVNVGNCPAGGCTVSIAFDADPFIQAAVDAGASAGSIARGTLAFSVTLTSVATGAIVFNWTPDGSVSSGVVGGTEVADAENLNSTVAALPGQSLMHSDPYGAGVFGHYAAITNALAAGNYTLSFVMTEATDVDREAASTVPEPATSLLIFVGLGVMGAMRRLRM